MATKTRWRTAYRDQHSFTLAWGRFALRFCWHGLRLGWRLWKPEVNRLPDGKVWLVATAPLGLEIDLFLQGHRP